MKAQEFWRNFDNQINFDRSILESAWDNATLFTTEIKETIKNAIRITHKEAKDYIPKHSYAYEEYVMQTEYFNIYIVAWQQKKDNDFYNIENGISNYQFEKIAWNFDISVEHENACKKWADEVIKLAYIFCDLRVVIGYFPYIKEGKEETQQKYLDAVSETIKTLKCRDNMKHGEFMIILGDVGGSEADGFKKLVYTPYQYNINKERFELLKK